MNLNKAYYSFVEHELYNYKNNLKEVREIEDEIINSSPSPSGERVQSSTLSDETATKAIKLTTTARLVTMRRNINGIQTGIRILEADSEERKRELLEMKYFDSQYTDARIAQELCISIETYYRWKRQIVTLMAMYMGLV